MATRAFDTLKAAKTLEEAGFEQAQAEAAVATVTSVVHHGIEAFARDLVTKDQFAETTSGLHGESVELRGDFAQLRTEFAELKADFAELKADFAQLRAEFAELRGEMHAGFAEVRAEFALEIKNLYRHLWLMAASIVGLTVTLTKLIP